MRRLDVEEGLDFVEAEINRFHSLYDTDDFHLLSCGPDPQSVGLKGGPVGVVMWGGPEEKFEECQKRLQPLLEAIEKIDLVLDVEVEKALGEDGEIWYIEFAKKCDLPEKKKRAMPWEQA